MKLIALLFVVSMASLLGSIHCRGKSRISSHKIKKNQALVGPVAAAVLADPQKFANASETFVKALGSAVEIASKAIEALKVARELISTTTTTKAIIVNLSKKEHTWYTYNDIALVKLITQFQSYMGAYTTVAVHTLGTGAMTCFKDNKGHPYVVERGNVYVFDGKNLSLFMTKPKKYRRH